MRVCHFTTVHHWSDTRVLHRQCVSLAERGVDIHLVVLNQKAQNWKGVHIHNIAVPGKGRLERMQKGPKAMLQKILELHADIYHFHDPELLPTGLKLRKLGKTVIYDSHEHYPRQMMSKKYIPRIFRPLIGIGIRLFEDYAVKRMSGLVAASDFVMRRFEGLNVPKVVVNNYPRLDSFTAVPTNLKKQYDVTYVGWINEIRGIQELIKMAELIAPHRLTLIGNFENEALLSTCKELPGWQQIDFLGRKNREEVATILGASRIGIVTFLPAPNHNQNQPNKLFEYMAAGIPIVCSDFEHWQAIVEEYGCGLCVNPMDPEEMAEAVHYFLKNEQIAAESGKRGLENVTARFNWANEEATLLEFYKELLNNT